MSKPATANLASPGRLEVLCGCMFAGKTTELIRRLSAAAGSGSRVLALRPVTDTRTPPGTLATHDGKSLPARPLPAASDLARIAADADVIGIDEIHFFGNSLCDPVLALIAQRKRVILAGVHLDHFGRPFEPFPSLVCHADEVVKLTAPCSACGRPACHSQRMVSGGGRIVVGGAESYQPRCRECFQPSTPDPATP